jgi:hypothetical protein
LWIGNNTEGKAKENNQEEARFSGRNAPVDVKIKGRGAAPCCRPRAASMGASRWRRPRQCDLPSMGVGEVGGGGGVHGPKRADGGGHGGFG